MSMAVVTSTGFMHEDRSGDPRLDVPLELDHHLAPHVRDATCLFVVGEWPMAESYSRRAVGPLDLPSNAGADPLRRKALGAPGDHLLVGLGELQVDGGRRIGKVQRDRFAEPAWNICPVSPEAG